MKATITIKKEVEVKTCLVKAEVMYWEDGTVNGIKDEDGDLIPCRIGDEWCPEIDIDNGKILNWKQGIKADVHYQICDSGSYYLKDHYGNIILSIEDNYVPNKLIPGYFGDYIIMDINENGFITNWNKNPSIEEFYENED